MAEITSLEIAELLTKIEAMEQKLDSLILVVDQLAHPGKYWTGGPR